MFTLVEHGDLYAPEPAGPRALLLACGKVMRVGSVDAAALARLDVPVETIDARGCYVVPGLVDPHVNLSGAGSESGFASRTPEVQFDSLAAAGITTVVGTLGTDMVARGLPDLLSKCRQIEAEGLTARMYTGPFELPSPTITGTIKHDVVYINEVIGTGELAISDVRSSAPTVPELARIVADTFMGGRISGKAGVTHFHVGDLPSRLAPLHELLDHWPVLPQCVYPTHVTRTPELFEDAIALAKRGCPVDTDCIEGGMGRWIKRWRDAGAPSELLTISSDAQTKDAPPAKLYREFVSCVLEHKLPLADVLSHFATNAARILKLPEKGRLKPGADADLLVVRKDTLELRHVIARGRVLVRDGTLVRPPHPDPAGQEIGPAQRKG